MEAYQSPRATTTDYTKQTLDDMTAHFDGAGSSYDQNYYNKLRGCFEKFNDTLLPRAQDQFWKG